MKKVSLDVISGYYKLNYNLTFLNRERTLSVGVFKEFFSIGSREAENFVFNFLKKFGKPIGIKRRSNDEGILEVIHELDDKREEQLFTIFKIYRGYKRNIYRELNSLLKEDVKKFDKKVNEIIKKAILEKLKK